MEENTCIYCGASIPEGILICPNCQKELEIYETAREKD